MADMYGDMTLNVTVNISPEDRQLIGLLEWLKNTGQPCPLSREHIKYDSKMIDRLTLETDISLTDEGKDIITASYTQSVDGGPFHLTITNNGEVIEHSTKPAWENM